MKNILLIGIGGTGSKAVDIFYQKYNELGNQTDNKITALVFDTDAGDLKKITSAKTVVMADNASVGTICDRFGYEYLKEWFPCDDKAVRAQEMVRGASQWRKKSYLAFLNLMNKPIARSTFISALEEMTVDPGASCEIFVIASVAGGTGSGSFIPIALYAKRYLRKNLGKDPIVNAMIALPDIYAESQTPENRIKVYSNAYAILRELNAINLVARNYNAGTAEHKKAPIRFRIGDPREPSVGLLFDASDKKFWTPEAAPFSQVFLLDRIPGLNSVAAHDIVLANSLYTILCTDIGSQFDSEFSNHELLRSQNNGSNAIYAGISTAQIRFPKESVLDYLAHKKTEETCNSEWLILHKAVENTIKDNEQAAKALKRRYSMKDGEYASIVMKEAENLERKSVDDFIAIMERCVYEYDSDGKRKQTSKTTEFATKVNNFISQKVPTQEMIKKLIKEIVTREIPDDGKIEKGNVSACAKEIQDTLLRYYQDCIEIVKGASGSTADEILVLDKEKEAFVGKDHSIIENLLKINKKYVHPVAAMTILCAFRNEITRKLSENNVPELEDLKKRNVDAIPQELYKVPSDQKEIVDKDVLKAYEEGMFPKNGKSAYSGLGKDRFKDIESDYESNEDIRRTNPMTDLAFVWQDANIVLARIYREAQTQLRRKVYMAVAQNLDILIAKYRNFFNRFEKEKEDLIESTKTAYRRDSGNVDSIINVYSSGKDKEAIYKMIVEEGGPITDAELVSTDDIVGQGVFETVFNAAASEVAQDNSFNDKDSGAYRSLFSNMVEAYKKSIEKSEAFEKIASYNAIEAIYESCQDKKDGKKRDEAFKSCFSVAQELATPSLRLDPNESEIDLVRPSHIMVFMMSIGTGRYLKKHADELGLHMPADQTKEFEVIRACAAEFIHLYSGNTSARVAIVDSMPDQVLYCTGEIMDITPLRIAKFNELGDDNTYFTNYSKALANFKKYGTDMWNPHLGNDLHKRGYLPYMNQEKEKDCDVKVVKALLYGFQKGFIRYKNSISNRNAYFFYCNGVKITDPENRWINNKNIAQLMCWMRNEDEIVEDWSERFDKDIQSQMNSLPSLASENPDEVKQLEKQITQTAFMKILTEKLYDDSTMSGARIVSTSEEKVTRENREGPTGIELAYMIKTSEELNRDCDDAERILDVLYSTFLKICDYRTPSKSNPELFIQVYTQQLSKVYGALASAEVVCAAGKECVARFMQLSSWLNQTEVFNTVSMDAPMDDKGNVCINTAYDYTKPVYKNDMTGKILNQIKSGKAEIKEEAPAQGDAGDEPAEK